MAALSQAAVAATVSRLRVAPKYRQIHEDTIADIVAQESAFATSDADLERRARLKLHRVVADYLFVARPARILRGLDEALAAGEVRPWCRAALGQHFSTAERLDDLDRIYPAMLELAGPAQTIADLACALNPLTLPWLRDVTTAAYRGYDLNMSYVEIGAAFLARIDPAATVEHRDILLRPEELNADVSLLLKTYHCIEDRQPGAALRLVERLGSNRVVISFPVRTMSGRAAAFTGAHLARLAELAQRRGWELRRSRVGNEEFGVLVKSGGPGDGHGAHD